MKQTIFLTLTLFFSFSQFSLAKERIIPIETNHFAMILMTDNNDHLKIIYSGKKIGTASEYSLVKNQYIINSEGASSVNQAFAVAGIDNNFVEPAIAVVHTDGNNSLDLRYESHSVSSENGATLTTIRLKDAVYPFYVDLFYKTWENLDVIEQWSAVSHKEKGKVILNKYASANLYFFDKNYYLTSYNGAWAREMQPVQTQLRQGMHSIQSRLGTRENLHSSQNFILAFGAPASEDAGTVMMGQLAWSGNYLIQFETDVQKNMHLVAGINPYQSAYELIANKVFETPRFIYTVSFEGTGKGSKNLHDWLRKHTLVNGDEGRLTLLNNWESTYFDFDQNKLAGLLKDAKTLGVDMFLLDDGWFGNKYPRNGDNAGLGDWDVNRKKLPDGIPFLVQKAKEAGVKFGLWIEPEMVNPKSELYEKRKDWVIREPERPEIYFRNQLVLDLTNPEVQDFVFGVVDNIMKENPEMAFLKWDCNAPIFNGHSDYLNKKKIPQSHLYVEYSKGLIKVLDRVREKYPHVSMMLCSGGGGRTDYGLLQYFTEFWLSDDTDPLERVFIQWDFSYYYPSITMCNHVTNWSNKPLKYRIDVASMGKLGFDIRVNELSKDDLAFAQQTVKNYDNFKDIVWHGDIYRLVSPYEADLASLVYVSPDKSRGVMFNYLTNWRYVADAFTRPVKLKGLDPKREYRIREINLTNNQQSPLDSSKTYSGEFLMNVGFNPQVSLYRSSVVIMIESA